MSSLASTPLAPDTLPSALINYPNEIQQRIAAKRAEVLAFAKAMIEVGAVTVSTPLRPDIVERRLVCRDVDAPGYQVVFVSVVDGSPEVSSMNFDFADSRVLRHIVHDDGLGITMVDPSNRPLVQYRID